MSGRDEAQVKVCPGITFPFLSRATAVNCCVPSRASVAVAGLTVTDLTTCATESEAVPGTPAVIAVIVATPFPRALATPVAGSTVATPGTELLQENVCPGMRLPFPSRATAVNCCVSPSASSVELAGETTTDLTTCATDSDALPGTPFAVAVIVATPFPSAVARPVAGSTVATPGGELVQANVCPGIAFPFAWTSS